MLLFLSCELCSCSVGRVLAYIDCRVSWVRIPPRAALFSLDKRAVLGVVDLFAKMPFYLVIETCRTGLFEMFVP